MKIGIIHGPNLNLLGTREPEIYGDEGFDSYLGKLRNQFPKDELLYFQSNAEGEIINEIQKQGAMGGAEGIVLNAGGYSHTSVAIADAVKACMVPVVVVHISNIYSREKERHIDLIAGYSTAMITGMGLKGYFYAVEYLKLKHDHNLESFQRQN